MPRTATENLGPRLELKKAVTADDSHPLYSFPREKCSVSGKEVTTIQNLSWDHREWDTINLSSKPGLGLSLWF